MARTYPDGTVSSTAGGGVGGTDASGTAMRHTPETEPAKQGFGWLEGVKGLVGGPNRAANPSVEIGPSSPLWRRPSTGVYTTGMQGKGRKR
jgi:hypothetical protein